MSFTARRERIPTNPWLIWGLGASFFFVEYFARVAPGVMTTELMQAFQVTASGLGALSAFFYYAYLGMQIPVGTLVDRYGPYRLLVVNAALCAFSCFLFAYAQNLFVAEMARLILGFSGAFAFVGTLKLATLWFSPRHFGLLAGMTQALGMLGGAVGEAPLAAMVTHYGWRHTMWCIGVLLFVIALLIALFVRDDPPDLKVAVERNAEKMRLSETVKRVLCNPQSWAISLFAGLLYAPTAAFAELWGASFVANVHQVSKEIAALGISLIFIGWTFGGPIAGWISDKLQRRKPVMLFSAIVCTGFLCIPLFVTGLPTWVIFTCLFFYGATNFGVATAYAVASEINVKAAAGTSIAFTNMASVIIGAAFQPVIGWILDSRWQGAMHQGIRVYSAQSYQLAMVTLPVCLVLSIVVWFFIKETHCELAVDSEPT